MDWEELVELFVDERVDFILGKNKAGRYSHWERKLFARMDEETRERFETAAMEEAEEAAGECREVYCQAFLDGLFLELCRLILPILLFLGFLASGSHGKESIKKEQP